MSSRWSLSRDAPSRLCARSCVRSFARPIDRSTDQSIIRDSIGRPLAYSSVRSFVRAYDSPKTRASARARTTHFILKPSHALFDDHTLWDPIIMNRRFLSDHSINTRDTIRKRAFGGSESVSRHENNKPLSRGPRDNAASAFQCHWSTRRRRSIVVIHGPRPSVAPFPSRVRQPRPNTARVALFKTLCNFILKHTHTHTKHIQQTDTCTHTHTHTTGKVVPQHLEGNAFPRSDNKSL